MILGVVLGLCMGGCLLYTTNMVCNMHIREGGSTRKTEINDSINDSFLSRLGLKLPINDSNNVFGFESLSMSRLCHLSRLCTRGYFSSKG
jgi:hypothetical protein